MTYAQPSETEKSIYIYIYYIFIFREESQMTAEFLH